MFASQAKSRGFESRLALQNLASKCSQDCSQVFTKNLLEDFIRLRASGTTPKTIRAIHSALDKFIGYPLTAEGINSYLNSLTCGNGKHNYFRCLKTLCRWLYHTEKLATNPIDKVLPHRSLGHDSVK